MAFRSGTVAVQLRTIKLLRLVGKLYPARAENTQSYLDHINMTPDELADKLLLEAVATKYPRVLELVKAQDKLEKAAIDQSKSILIEGANVKG